MLRSVIFLLIAGALLSIPAVAQHLKPGFDASEYTDLLKLSARFGHTPAYYENIPLPAGYHSAYRSPELGLDNCWELWLRGSDLAVISIRGTTANSVSWLANFYAAMVPAKGGLQLSDTETFSYELADHPKAAVHVGWLVGMAFLAKDMLPRIDSCYRQGIRDLLIMGHSQGGAIAYLLTAYLHNLQKNTYIPADIRFKTYCSAAPKPGNLYFAYAYEAATQDGWSYNVVNSADWVPEVPVSIQTVDDFNATNPFVHAKDIIKKQKLRKRLLYRHLYNKLDKPTRIARKNYQTYLGKLAADLVKKNLNGYLSPELYNSNHYVRTGTTIVLLADSAYLRHYPDSEKNIMVHHLHPPYLYLTGRLRMQPVTTQTAGLPGGAWELSYISGRKIVEEEIYPHQKPLLVIDSTELVISGNTGCNTFRGTVRANGSSIVIDPGIMTRKWCEGEGEQLFLETLKSVEGYVISDNFTLELLRDRRVIMRFIRKG